ncbi:unnamed protein product [Adineta steineri]|uniref:Reverse transcriptase domain-containing protein n=1 Tax=Adineta steineri TaxID=433720 RepID=A0A819BYK4_9BILA|nr:unnamed protein product [Adineta steineri]CAF3810167.1 unnamed protein product [Adineta steineri]
MDSTSIDSIDEIYICSTDNEKQEFERIHGFISCTKCYHTSVYRPRSGTKRFIDHANQCSPLASQSTTSPNDPQATQSTLDKIVIKRQINITTKEQNGFLPKSFLLKSGTTQGSPLSPLLHILYTSDSMNDIHQGTQNGLFADDTTL